MKYIFHTVALILFSILQPTWPEWLLCFGVVPNLFLVYVIAVNCWCSQKEGSVLGFVAGLVLDLVSGGIIGLNAILMMVLAFFVSTFYASVIRKNTLLITLVIVAITTLIYEGIYYIVAFLGDLHFAVVFVDVLLPECLCSVIAAVPLYLVTKKLAKSFWDDKGEGLG